MSHMRKSYMQIPQLLDIPFFDNLKKATSAFNIQKLQPKLKLCHYSRGEIVYSYTNQRQFVFVIKGTISIYLSEENSTEDDQVQFKGQNEYFGEQQIVNQRRITKAIAELPTVVYKLSVNGMYQHFRSIFIFPELESKINYIKSLPYFSHINEQHLQKIIQTSTDLKPSMNSIICYQGEKINSVYIIMRGDFELSKKPNKKINHSIDVSLVSTGQCIGLQETLMNQPSQQTVKCVSSNAWLIELDKSALKNYRFQYNRQLIKSRSNWRKKRVLQNQSISLRYKSVSIDEENNLDHFQSVEQKNQRKSSNINYGTISNTQNMKLRPNSCSYFRKVQPVQLNLLPEKPKRLIKVHTQQEIAYKTTTDMGQIFRNQFMQKKQRVQNNMLIKYLKTRPPELVFNPQKQYAVMKSLIVKPSEAIKNRKKTLAILKHKYFKSFISFQK